MNGIKYLKEQGIQDRIINPEDLPEYQMKLSGMLEHFYYLMDKSKLHQPTVISAVCEHTKGSCKIVDKKHTMKCDDCGEIIWQTDL